MKRHTGEHARAKRSLGQNFLSDARYISRIVAAVDAGPSDTVVEIGPGRGALTEWLVETGANVLAVELDRDLIEPLRNKFNSSHNFTVVEADALEVDFGELLHGKRPDGESRNDPGIPKQVRYNAPARSAKLAANLPYYISTAILQHLERQRENFSEMVLMFQRDVVERLTAKPENSERGYLTVLAESAFVIERLFDVPPAAFRPVPKVHSSVVKLLPKQRFRAEDEFRQLVSAAFAQKRKTIANNLKPFLKDHLHVLAEARIEPNRRAETLTLAEWHDLTEAFVRSAT